LILNAQNQKNFNYHTPINNPYKLSGNFGELRSNHFHSGIDIKTNGQIGKKLYAIEAGYISRIVVKANGYGKAIYINHPDGNTSVYAHLNRFSKSTRNYVKSIQYKKESFEVDIYLPQNKITVEKGEIIGFSGNTGGSSGPHLHFEIRETTKQIPQNPLLYNFHIEDNRAPKILNTYLYQADISKNTANYSNTGNLSLHNNDTVTVLYPFALGIETFDFFNLAPNRCIPYEVELKIDSITSYSFKLNEIPFSESRYVNAHMDYQLKINNKKKVHRLHLLPNNKLNIYEKVINNGIVLFKDSLIHKGEIIVKDLANNSTTLTFWFKGTLNNILSNINFAKYSDTINVNFANSNIHLKENTLYQDHKIKIDTFKLKSGELFQEYKIADKSIPVHKKFELEFYIPKNINDSLKHYLSIYCKNDEEYDFVDCIITDDKITATPKEFGIFTIKADTVPPTIKPLKRRKNRKSLRFIIKDNLSGINKYKGFIDGKWALFEYDKKNDLLIYYFDKQKIKPRTLHKLKLIITDKQNNQTVHTQNFRW